MTINGWIQIALYCVILIALTKPFGGYLTRVFNGERTFLSPVLGWLERGVYRLSGVDPAEEQHWLTYGFAMFAFSVAGFVVLYAIQRLQGVLPFNPQGLANVEPSLAFNTSVSFISSRRPVSLALLYRNFEPLSKTNLNSLAISICRIGGRASAGIPIDAVNRSG